VAAFGQTLFQIVQSFALMRQKIVAGASLQTAMWDRLMKLKNSFFRYYSTGDLQARVTSMSAIQEQLSGATLRTLFTSILASLNLGLMCYYDLSLAFIAFVVALVASLMTASAGVLTLRYMRPLHRLKGELSGIAVQLIHGMAKLRVAGAEARAFAHWGQHYSRQQILQRRVQCIQDSMTVVNSVLPALALVVLFWAAMQALLNPETTENKSLTAGTFLAFHAAFSVFVGGATSLSNALIELADVATLWERAKPIVEADLEADETKVDPGQLSGKLSVDHVTFRYERDGHIRLDDVSLHAEPGEFIALVGPSGSGKSTLLRVLLGLEAPESGAVRYDDQDLSRLDAVAIRRQIGTVLQQNTIMAGTIFENLAAGGLITIDDAWEAIRAAGLEEEIAAMPMQMNTFVGDGGGNLSGGQRQRLLIARSIVRKPAIVLFDEATSALDNHTQAMVTASLERLRATRVMIAHRLSTIQHADRIYVIDGGRIVQQGYFDELARQEGLFANLMAQQTS